MGAALWWLILGYMSCAWDCSSSPHDPRWPSATGLFVVLLAMRVPRFSLWGAALCGLVMDAANGGPLGPRVLAGVLMAALVSHAKLGEAETCWPTALLVSMVAITLWLVVPLVASSGGSMSSFDLRAQSQSCVTTTLIVLALRSVTIPPPL